MRLKTTFVLGLALLLLAGAQSAFAQRLEIHPYIGGLGMGDYLDVDLKNSFTYGLKAGAFVTSRFEIEGNIAGVQRVELRGQQGDIRGIQWEGVGSFHFFPRRFEKIMPYLNVGLGGLTLNVDDDDFPGGQAIFATVRRTVEVPGGAASETTRILVADEGRTFFSVTYGGGLKGLRLWGPIGLRAGINGRTSRTSSVNPSVRWR
jgi:hypothetical protein